MLIWSGLASSASATAAFFGAEYSLEGVNDEGALRRYLDLLNSSVLVDLHPALNECYALGPYTTFDAEKSANRTDLGELLYQAKYWNSRSASEALLKRLLAFVAQHPTLRNVDCIVPAPKSDTSTPDLPAQWARDVAMNQGMRLLSVAKTRVTDPQKALGEEPNEAEAAERLSGSMAIPQIDGATTALILDDTIGSAGTMLELARALRFAGARTVAGLSVAKDAKFTRGGVSLLEEDWQ